MKTHKLVLPYAAAALIVATVSGCALMGPEQNALGGGRVTTASANQIFDPGFEGFSDEQLLQLLDPENKAKLDRNYQHLNNSEKIAQLRMAFRKANDETTVYGDAHRAQVQDRLIAASNQRCNVYMTYLKRVSTYTNGVFGTLTTILGGAGSIVTGENASRLLSGLAGISSGTRAELNQAIFESVATSVIIPGIRKTRKELLAEILAKRSKSIAEYTVEGAIADAILYHGACSMDAGIGHAQKSIQSFDDIGVKRFTAIQTDLGIARGLSESFTLGPIGLPIRSEKLLDEFSVKLATYKAKLDLSKFGDVESLVKDGDLRKKAKSLDEKLKELLFSYAVATGSDKTDAYSRIDAQQRDAKDFARQIDRKNAELLDEIQKLAK